VVKNTGVSMSGMCHGKKVSFSLAGKSRGKKVNFYMAGICHDQTPYHEYANKYARTQQFIIAKLNFSTGIHGHGF
jgi:hypothetical protein